MNSDEAHLFKGIVWICIGLKLGAIESVIGFANIGFAGAMSRRLLRFLSRGFLTVGLAKGYVFVTSMPRLSDQKNAVLTTTRISSKFRKS